jgi:hypothetical protein
MYRWNISYKSIWQLTRLRVRNELLQYSNNISRSPFDDFSNHNLFFSKNNRIHSKPYLYEIKREPMESEENSEQNKANIIIMLQSLNLLKY